MIRLIKQAFIALLKVSDRCLARLMSQTLQHV